MRLGIREQFGAGLKQGLSLPRVCGARPTTEVDRYDSEGTGKQSVAMIGSAKIAGDKARRKVLMQEAFDLLTRASALR